MTNPRITELEAILNATDSKVEIGNDGNVRVRGYMGGTIAGGADVDDADREGYQDHLTPSPTIIDPGVTGLPHLCPKCGASVPPAQTSQVCVACTHSLIYPYSTKVQPGDGMMGRVPHAQPTTVAEWVAQARETGILEFEQLLAIEAQQAPLVSMATKMLEFVREYDPETLIIKRGDGKRNHPSPLCQCSECQAKFDGMGKPLPMRPMTEAAR